MGLTFANYIIKPFFPTCDVPDLPKKLIAASVICKCVFSHNRHRGCDPGFPDHSVFRFLNDRVSLLEKKRKKTIQNGVTVLSAKGREKLKVVLETRES